jgi:uncharacterized protein YciI
MTPPTHSSRPDTPRGPRWVDGRPMTEQDIGAHVAYVTRLFEAGTLLAGGPVPGADEGRYIVALGDGDARALIDADPGVTGGVFRAEAHPWTPLQRSGVAR